MRVRESGNLQQIVRTTQRSERSIRRSGALRGAGNVKARGASGCGRVEPDGGMRERLETPLRYLPHAGQRCRVSNPTTYDADNYEINVELGRSQHARTRET